MQNDKNSPKRSATLRFFCVPVRKQNDKKTSKRQRYATLFVLIFALGNFSRLLQKLLIILI